MHKTELLRAEIPVRKGVFNIHMKSGKNTDESKLFIIVKNKLKKEHNKTNLVRFIPPLRGGWGVGGEAG